jgi:hypothetical protein
MEMKIGGGIETKNRTNAGSHCARARFMRPKPLALPGQIKTWQQTDETKETR